MKKSITALLATVLCVGLLSACGTPAPASSVAEKAAVESAAPKASSAASEAAPAKATLPETFVLGLDASFPPMGFTDQNNQIIGVDIDLAKAVCDKLGMKFEAKPIDWASKEMELNTGKISCVWNGLTMTGREEIFELSRAYMDNEQAIVVMQNSSIKSKADLADKIVAVQTDSSGYAALQKDPILASVKGGASKEYADYVTAMGDLELGRCDAIVMDSVVANYYITANAKPMVVLDEVIASEQYAIGFKKGEVALKDAVEGALSELAKEGRIDAISTQWFGKPGMIITY